MDVPFTAGAGCTSPNSPLVMDISNPSLFSLADTTFTSDTDVILANASPRNPSVSIVKRSSTVAILLVLYRLNAMGNSSPGIPHPLSVSCINCWPPFSTTMEICVAPASRLFSTNSFTTEAGRSTTSPAEILLRRSSDNSLIIYLLMIFRVFLYTILCNASAA